MYIDNVQYNECLRYKKHTHNAHTSSFIIRLRQCLIIVIHTQYTIYTHKNTKEMKNIYVTHAHTSRQINTIYYAFIFNVNTHNNKMHKWNDATKQHNNTSSTPPTLCRWWGIWLGVGV